jgi:hypothetical protein
MVIILTLLLVLVPGNAENSARPDRPVNKAECVFAIYVEDWSYAPQNGPRLILGLWSDGHIVWSRDQVHGGPPYRSGEIESSDLERLLADLDDEGVFDDTKLAWSWVPVDSDFTTILARSLGREGAIRSRHEIEAEMRGRAALEETPEFRHFKSLWEKIRRAAESLIPEKSVAVQGELVLVHGDLAWRERAR